MMDLSAGRGSRRAPYDYIYTDDGLTLRRKAQQLPTLEGEEEAQVLPRRTFGPRRPKKKHSKNWVDSSEEEEEEEAEAGEGAEGGEEQAEG